MNVKEGNADNLIADSTVSLHQLLLKISITINFINSTIPTSFTYTSQRN